MNLYSNIDPKKISIIIQGPIIFDNKICITETQIENLKIFLPNSEIILSTWDDQETSSIKCKIIKTIDPGQITNKSIYQLNSKRLFVSTQEGLKNCSREYCLKIRSDTTINNKIIKITNLSKNNKINLFMHSTPNLIFLIDDKVQFGLTDNLKKIWNFDFDQTFNNYEKIFKKSKTLSKYALVNNYLVFDQIICVRLMPIKILFYKKYINIVYFFVKYSKKEFNYLNAIDYGFGSVRHLYKNDIKIKIYLYIFNNHLLIMTLFYYLIGKVRSLLKK